MKDPETPPDENSEAATAPTVTASEAENPVDQNKDSNSADNLTEPAPAYNDNDVAPRIDRGESDSGDELAAQAVNPVSGDLTFIAHTGDRTMRATQMDVTADSEDDTPSPSAPKVVMVSINELETDPLNSGIYTPASMLAQTALSESMKAYGVLSPLLGHRLADGKIRVKSGHRRAAAAKDAGLTHVPIQLIDPPGERAGQELLVHANIQRDKTNEERIREFLALREGASERAKARQKAGARNKLMKNPPEAEKGTADDIAAKQVGLSRPTALKGAQVVLLIDQLIAEGKQDEAEQLRQILKGQSFEAAIKAAMDAGHVKPPSQKSSKHTKTSSDNTGPGTPIKAHAKAVEQSDKDGIHDSLQPTAPPKRDANDAPEPQRDARPRTNEKIPEDRTHIEGEAEDDDLPPIVQLTAAMIRIVDAHEALELDDATNDQKRNLTQAFTDLSEWYENHSVMLRIPGPSDQAE